MAVKPADIKALRTKTGAGMMECKKALEEFNGDAQAAEDYLKEKGLAAVEKRSGRETTEGIIVVKESGNTAVMTEVTCETDFVSKNADFIEVAEKVTEIALDKKYTAIESELTDIVLDLATRMRENMTLARLASVSAADDEYIAHYVHSDKKTGVLLVLKADKPEVFKTDAVKEFAFDCCLHAAAFTPAFVSEKDIPQSYIDEQMAVFKEEVAELDKPDNIKEGIMKGKLSKHVAGICFFKQAFVKDDSMSVEKKMAVVSKDCGATLSLSSLVLYELGKAQ